MTRGRPGAPLALRERLGPGARFDAETAPHRELLWARRGTAYFARHLQQVPDVALDADSLMPGWSRRALVAHVGYNARALCRLVEWARTGRENPMYRSAEQRDAEIARGATLSPVALRHLFDHAKVHLNVEWRDLADDEWDRVVRTAQGRLVPVSETAWMRAREVWIHAVDLGSGARFDDFPTPVLERLVDDVVAAWEKRGELPSLTLAVDDGPTREVGEGGTTVRGTLGALVGWLCGRGPSGTRADTGTLPDIPRWL